MPQKYGTSDDDMTEDDKDQGDYPPIVRAALRFDDTLPSYQLFDAESNTPFLKATTFQLEYIKANIVEPKNPKEGWYLPKRLLSKILNDLDVITDQIAHLEEQEDDSEDDDNADENELTETELLDRRAVELGMLHEGIKVALGDYDAFEFTWQLLSDEESDTFAVSDLRTESVQQQSVRPEIIQPVSMFQQKVSDYSMANDSGVIIPPAMSELVDARNLIWDQLNKSQAQVAALNKLASQVPSGTPSKTLEPLIDKNAPPAELAVALPQLEKELAHIQQVEKSIEDRYAEINRIKNQAVMIVIGVVVTIVVTIVVMGAIIVASIHH